MSHSHYALLLDCNYKNADHEVPSMETGDPSKKITRFKLTVDYEKSLSNLPFLYPCAIEVKCATMADFEKKPDWEEILMFEPLYNSSIKPEPQIGKFIIADFYYKCGTGVTYSKILIKYEYGQIINNECLIIYMYDNQGGADGTCGCCIPPLPLEYRIKDQPRIISKIYPSVSKPESHLIPMLCFPDQSYMLNPYFCYGIVSDKEYEGYHHEKILNKFWTFGHNDLPHIHPEFGVLCHQKINIIAPSTF